MFLQIFVLPITRYVFLAGAVINGLFVMFRGYPFMNVLWVSMIGGFVFCGVWAGIIKILMILLTEQELAYFFKISTSEGVYFDDIDDDDDELTIDDLYNTSPEIDEYADDDDEDTFSSEYPAETIDTPESPEIVGEGSGINLAKTEVVLNNPEQFQITVQGKTLKAHPRDGANAIKKAIYDDEQKNQN